MNRRAPSEDPTLGVLLRRWRERALLTQDQLAERAGLNVRTVRRLEAGEPLRPRSASVRSLAEALDLGPAELTTLTRAVTGAPETPAPQGVRPRQLPADVDGFVGRASELAALTGIRAADAVAVTAIDGMAGVGKTALAVRAAHRLASRYPDGHLFVDLHGHTRTTAAADPADLLARLLGALGVEGESIPLHADDRAALYRSVLADRRMLIVLDNAADEGQVRPLLPGTGGCRVLITSRRRLIGLTGARIVSVDVLPQPEAIALFAASAGRERVADAAPGSLSELARCCGRLPLAVRLAAARLKAHPAWTVEYLLQRLREGWPLGELYGGQHSVTTALDLSYRDLPPPLARGYRLLGLHPGAHITPEAAAATLGTPAASATLEQLLEVHLLQEPAPGHYTFHDLIRAHAVAAAEAEEPEPERRAALTRLLDHYSENASAAMDHLYPYEADTRPQPPRRRTAAPADPADWLEAELPNLLPIARFAAENGYREHARHLAGTLHRCLRTRGRYAEADGLHRKALSAAQAAGDRVSEVEALVGLAELDSLRGNHDQAVRKAACALEIARESGHGAGELRALIGLGFAHLEQLDLKRAAEHYRQALDTARAAGHRTGELDALIGSGHVGRALGNEDSAVADLTEALRIARAIGHRTSEARALIGLGYVHLKRAELGPAAGRFERALELARATGYRVGELSCLAALGDLHHLQGRHEPARRCFEEIADLSRRIGNRNWEFEAIHSLGRLDHAAGRPEQALARHDRALRLAGELNQPGDEARAHDGLAHAHDALGRPDQARDHWARALALLTALGITETDERGVDVETLRRRVDQKR
ncbi:ATP-binding protein [Amycolatopsis sp. lyj-109]|uniref:ATP-binding protein n=1 Tax=Amycolatopsis sp. lyj-109 TaxID=2789287 RepID=UPI003979A54B